VAEPLKEVRGTPGFRGTPVEKHRLSLSLLTQVYATAHL